MMNDLPHITQSEWAVMKELWKKSPLTVAELVENIQSKQALASTTIKTLLRRLIAKEAVDFTIDEKNAKLYYYVPLVSEEDCVKKASKEFLKQYHQDNAPRLFAAFMDNTDLSVEEIDHLKDLLERKKAEAND
ncbi:BlaI family penicillinase repressor [Clostridiales Family XIII bacterium PM5-7]